MLAVGDSRSIVSIFDLATKQRIARLEFSGPVLNLAFTPDGANLIAISSQGHITAWNPLTGERKKHQKLDCRSPVRDAGTYGSLCFLASGNDVFLRDALNASSVSTVLSHEKIVVSCCFSRDGQLLLSASDDGIVRVWSCPAGKLVASTPRLSRGIRSVGFTADAGRFAAGARGGTVRIYQTANGEPATGTFNHGATVTRVIFSPDGRYLVTTSGDTDESGVEESALRVWDTATGEPIFARAVKTISARFSVPFDEDRSWRLAAAFFAADGNSFHVVTATGIVDHFDLRPDVRRSGDLLRQVRIRSGMELDSTGALNVLESEQVRTLFGSRSESD
jgi:WD40 repeat protein